MALKQIIFLLAAALLAFCPVNCPAANDEALKKEVEMLKQRILELESKVEAADKEKETLAAEKAAESREGAEEVKPRVTEVKEEIQEKLGLEFHGSAVPFYQGSPSVDIEDEHIDSSSGAGISADLELTWKPGMDLFENGRFFMRAHVGEGRGSDEDLGDRLFANLNTLADDSDDETFRLLEAYYAHEFFGGKALFSIGKTEPLVFIDKNVFANDEITQFVGKPFVNNPVLDSEDEYGPIVAASISPLETLTFTALCASSSFPNAPDEEQKSIWDDIFNTPLVAGELAWSPKFGGRQGHYRIYAWDALYEHSVSHGDSEEAGWGVGISMDQQVTDMLGFFSRLGYSNEDAYEVEWFWSLGANLKGILPCRENDELGIGLAGLKGSGEDPNDGTELHLETYYRIALAEHLAVSPDFQYVLNPLGNDDNDGVFAGMLRGEFSF